MAMIKHQYAGYGIPPSAPQLPSFSSPSSSLFPSSSSSSSHSNGAPGSEVKLVIPKSPITHTTYPYVTGSSVIGIKYKDGVMMISDTMGAYGRTMRYKSVERMKAVGENCLIGASGELSDFFYINTLLDELVTSDFTYDDGHKIGPQQVHSYLNRVLYNRRNKFDPLWNTLIIAGLEAGQPYLGMVNMIGLHYCDSHVVSGYANYLARPILREEHSDDMEEKQAVILLEKCMRVLFYRDSSCINKVQISKVTAAGVVLTKPYALDTEWGYNFFVNPTKHAVGSW